jgi:hypothetical protein
MAPVNVWSDSLWPGGLVGVLVGAFLAAAAAGVARAETPVPSPAPSSTVTAEPSPSPSGTPWPAPAGVTVRVEAILLDANNFPLPPEKQVHTAVVTWPHLAEFTGTYEIEHGIAAFRSSAPRKWQLAGTVDADAAVDGTLRWEEPIQSLSLSYCYRVRTVMNGETGPYSAEACIPEPPGSGPAPAPPDVGNSAGHAPGDGLPLAWLALAAAVFAGGPFVAGWAALRKRRG